MELVADDQRLRERRRTKIRRRDREGRTSLVPVSGASGSASGSSSSVSTGETIVLDDRILRAIEPLSWLRRSERSLVHHFVSEASSIVIASHHGQRLFCNTIVPLALQSPSLLYALLAYSTAQRATLREVPADGAVVLDPSISRYVGMSLSAFRTELLRNSCSSKTSLLASSLMLCLVSVSYGDIDSGSWRVHAEGAKALLASIRQSKLTNPSSHTAELEAVIRFLSRWLLTVESLSSLTSSTLDTEQCVVDDHTWRPISSEPEELALDVCDDHFGYPTRLALLFREIGAASWERRRQLPSKDKEVSPDASPDSSPRIPILTEQDFEGIADSLQYRLNQIAAETIYAPNGLSFYPGVREELTDRDVHDFTACSEAYIAMAHILIEKRVRGSPSRTPSVQASMRVINRAIGSMKPSPGSSPAMGIGPPLFTAGCEALEEADRQAVRENFHKFNSHIKSENVNKSLEILEKLWARGFGEVMDWLTYQGETALTILKLKHSRANQSLAEMYHGDFLPY